MAANCSQPLRSGTSQLCNMIWCWLISNGRSPFIFGIVANALFHACCAASQSPSLALRVANQAVALSGWAYAAEPIAVVEHLVASTRLGDVHRLGRIRERVEILPGRECNIRLGKQAGPAQGTPVCNARILRKQGLHEGAARCSLSLRLDQPAPDKQVASKVEVRRCRALEPFAVALLDDQKFLGVGDRRRASLIARLSCPRQL